MQPTDQPLSPPNELLNMQLDDSQRFLQIVFDLADHAATAGDASEFTGYALRRLCDGLHYSVAVYWQWNGDSQQLHCTHVIDLNPHDNAEFVALCKSAPLKSGEQLPGRVWSEKQPLWQTDFHADISARARAAERASLHSSVAFAVGSNNQFVGVVELIGNGTVQENGQITTFFRRLGAYLASALMTDQREQERVQALSEKYKIELNAREEQRKRLEQQLQAIADEAINSSRLKSEFVANVSHEIRTPLAGILGMAELLSTREDTDAETRELAAFILSSAQSLLDVVNDLLDFSKLEAGKLSLHAAPFCPAEVLRDVARSIAVPAGKKNLKVTVEMSADLPAKVIGDRSRLMQVLLNFAHNAVKFTERGEITLDAELESRTTTAQRIRFRVRDTGIGIKPESRHLLFQPFVQVDGSTTRRYGGTGLGLSIAKKLSQLMSGEIGMQSEVGQGSLFWVSVPFELTDEL